MAVFMPVQGEFRPMRTSTQQLLWLSAEDAWVFFFSKK